jgi:hypothetical protein
MMLIAKYAKVFHVLVPPQHVSRRILRIRKTLGALPTPTVTTSYLTAFLGLAKLWPFCPVLGKLFPRLPQKGKETIKKYTAGNMGSKKRVPAGLRQPGYPAVATPLTLLWVDTNKSDDRY